MKSNPLILILVAIGLLYTFANPQYQKTKALRVEAQKYQDVINDVEKLSTRRDELLAKYRTIPQEEVDKLTKLLPDHVDTVQLAIDLDGIASQYGITIKELDVTNKKKDDSTSMINTTQNPYEKVNVSFTFISTYPDFLNFIKDVESSLRIADIRYVSFESNDNGIYEFKVEVETYWLAE